MDAWLGISLELRLAVLGIVGAGLGSMANYLTYARCFFPREISPWAPPHPEAPPRRWMDRLPIVGWLALRREAAFHAARPPRHPALPPTSRWHWLRPLFVELLAALGAAALYWWEIDQRALYPGGIGWTPAAAHWQLAAHLLLLTLLLAATLIDLDERTVPDAVTLPGTWLALLLTAAIPGVLLPVRFVVGGGAAYVDTLFAATPWPVAWDGVSGLWLGLACYAGWCFAIAGKTCTLRRGVFKGAQFLAASLWRRNQWLGVPLMLLVGVSVISLVWAVGGEAWQGLLTSLLGIAVGGGFIWCIRVVSGVSLGIEAMGFGDVILLGMIGAFLGWQAALLAFFLAPFCAIPLNLVMLLFRGQSQIAFGPYLAAGAALVIVFWAPLWQRAELYFRYAPLLFGVLGLMLAAMGTLLAIWRPIRERLQARG